VTKFYTYPEATPVKRRVRVSWQGKTASRQATNTYVFTVLSTEFGSRTVYQGIEIQIPQKPSLEVGKAQEALRRRREEMERRWMARTGC
jgi:hypothetical protein